MDGSDKTAQAEHPIHPLIAARWSSRSFADRSISDDDVRVLLEAARWAPSSFNEQPWSFVVARREEAERFEKLLDCLFEGNRSWARRAALLMLSVARMSFARNGKPNRHAFHDVGLATANMALQATELGLNMHQMAGFDRERAREVFRIPEGCEPVTLIALGYRGSPDDVPDRYRESERAPRSRKPLSEMVYGEDRGTD